MKVFVVYHELLYENGPYVICFSYESALCKLQDIARIEQKNAIDTWSDDTPITSYLKHYIIKEYEVNKILREEDMI